MKPYTRICIYPKDIVRITGKGERYARKLLDTIKLKLAKENHQYVSINEFCQYTGLSIDEVLQRIID